MANPPPDFVDIPFTPDANAMADNAIENLRATWTDWEPDDADPSVILIESVAPMAASSESMAAQVPGEIIRAIGALYGVEYDNGTPAQTTVTLTFVDGNGYTVPAAGQINIDGYAFALNEDAVIPPNTGPGPYQLANVPVSSTVNAQAANSLDGSTISVSLNLPPFVTAVAVDAPTSDGTDPMDDTTYTNLVVAKIRLRGDTLVTAGDFALEATLQPGVGFAWGQGNTARKITVVVADPNALPCPASVKAALNAIYTDPSVRSINLTSNILDPVYTTVGVAYRVMAAVGAGSQGAQTAITNLLNQVLSPLSAVKSTDQYVRVNKLIALIGGLQQVDYVESVTLSGNPIAALSSELAPIAAPPAPVPTTAATGGTVAAGTYEVAVTYVTANGETVGSATGSVTTTGTTSTITVPSPPAETGATGWYAYVSQAGGAALTRQQAAGSPTAIGTDLTLTAPPTSTGTAPPTSNTAAVSWTGLPVAALTNTIASGAVLTMTDGANTQTWTTTAAAAIGDTTISVESQVPNFPYPSGQGIAGPVVGDLAMAGGIASLPTPGTFTGTIDL